MHVFHFGTSDKRLLGVYHPAARSKGPAAGVVICQPLGHEYIRAHRVLKQLASRLSADGLHVLRFDYHATGDSAGDAAEGTVAQWRTDVGAAIDELKDMADLTRVSLVGVRLGAALGALASAGRQDVDALVLWDPVVKGAEYLRQLLDLQHRWLGTRPWIHVPPDWPEDGELLGFPLAPALRAELDAIDLVAMERWPRRVWIAASRGVDGSGLHARLSAEGVLSAVDDVPCECDWNRVAAVHLTLLANEMAQQIAGYFESRGAA